MKTMIVHAALAAALLGSTLAAAQPAAVVEGVQMPAWVERSQAGKLERSPLAPGMELKAGDQLKTGPGSRLLVKLSEGSLVKLGENGNMRVADLQPSKDLFRGALAVLEGAFRFTTQKIGANRRRDINISVAQVTAGIRGTDLWGRSRSEKQIVCLIEGKIEVGAQGEAAVTMDQPLQFYQREKGQTAPVGFVDKKQLDEWARETEIEAGKATLRTGGRFSVTLASAESQADALKVYDLVRDAGYAAQIRPVKQGEKLVYVVRIANLAGKAEAEAVAAQLKGKFGVADPKVSS
ncbi:MAG: FecR domain-containing protein [Betaproteobacteria bacterium]|nr:FecR domain-containing protein [Betaproteobacteria bacterium]